MTLGGKEMILSFIEMMHNEFPVHGLITRSEILVCALNCPSSKL